MWMYKMDGIFQILLHSVATIYTWNSASIIIWWRYKGWNGAYFLYASWDCDISSWWRIFLAILSSSNWWIFRLINPKWDKPLVILISKPIDAFQILIWNNRLSESYKESSDENEYIFSSQIFTSRYSINMVRSVSCF